MKKTPPVRIAPKLGNVDRVISFRIEGVIADFLISKGIDPKLSAREYLRELAKDEGLTGPEADAPKSGK
jgi:hypothetical protein